MAEYTIEQFKQLYGDNYLELLSNNVNVTEPTKPVIYAFNDLDNATKTIYNNLYSLLEQKNENFNGLVLTVVGRRVTGNWLSQQEADQIFNETGVGMQVTPYEYCTNAPLLPDFTELNNISPSIDLLFNCSNETHAIIVPPSNE